MKLKTLSKTEIHTFLMFAFIAFCIVCILPHSVLCTGLFADDGASTNALNDICAAYSRWWPVLQVVSVILYCVTHDKVKDVFGKIVIGVFIGYLVANNIDWIIGTANSAVNWFGGIGRTTSSGT